MRRENWCIQSISSELHLNQKYCHNQNRVLPNCWVPNGLVKLTHSINHLTLKSSLRVLLWHIRIIMMIKTDSLDPLAGLWKVTCSHLKSVLRGCGEENRKNGRLRMGDWEWVLAQKDQKRENASFLHRRILTPSLNRKLHSNKSHGQTYISEQVLEPLKTY